MSRKIAFAGFRHGHIMGLYRAAVQGEEGLEATEACEEHAPTRENLQQKDINVTHTDFDLMLHETDAEILAVGDCYGNRGRLLIEGLKNGMHVIADKPLCTDIAELEEIERLSREKHLCVGCQLDQRDNANFRALRRVIQEENAIGTVHAVHFGGQHPLMYGTRPEWYFEPGKHGGTINDIAIHAIDLVPWIIGSAFQTVNAARNWNAALPQVPHFKDAAQLMLTMTSGCGVMGDVSYLVPNSFGYRFPLYWRYTFWGDKGVAETCMSTPGLDLFLDGESRTRHIEPDEKRPLGYLSDFVADIEGAAERELHTAAVLTAARHTLMAQQAADEGLTNVIL